VLKLITLVFLCIQSSYSLEADFFKRQKALEKQEKARLKGASSYTKKREKIIKAKAKEASKYYTVRKNQERYQKKRDLSFESNFKKPVTVNTAKERQAQKYAKKKRSQKSENWKVQNLEYGIEVIKPRHNKKN